EPFRARDVGPLADHDEVGLWAHHQGFGTAVARVRRAGADLPRCDPVDGMSDRRDPVGRRSATAANDVEPAAPGELTEHRTGLVRAAPEPAEAVGHPRVGVTTDTSPAESCQTLERSPHEVDADSAVQPDA